MRRSKHGESRTRLYGLVNLTSLLLVWSQLQLQVQAQSSAPSVTEQDLNDLVKLNVVSGRYSLSFSIDDEDKDKYTIENITCKTGSEPTVVANDRVCEGLDPCSSYTNEITLKAVDVEEATSFTQSLLVYTDYSDPQTTLLSVNATDTAIEVSWETTDRACVKAFEIIAVATDNTQSTQRLSDESSYIFDKIWPCRTYNVTIYTKNNETLTVDTDTQLVDTGYLEPGDLTLSISNRSNGDTRITWSEPDNKSCIGNYTFLWRRLDCVPEEDTTSTTTETTTTGATDVPEIEEFSERYNTRSVCEWNDFSNDTTLKEYTLSDLHGCEKYSIEVYINAERHTRAKGEETFSSAEKLPSAVSNPYQIVNATELQWLWYPPAVNPKCAANYRVNLTGPIRLTEYESDEQLTSDTWVYFTKLHPCGVYNVEIVPISLNGSAGTKFQGQSTLSEDQPSQILEPTSILKNFSIELSWKTPEYADLCIDGYRITGWMDDNKVVEALSVSTQDTTVLFEKDLIACQAYTIQIIPYTRENLDGELRQIDVETAAAVVNSKKISLQLAGSGATSHGMELNANNMDYDNNCQTFFANFSCITRESVVYTYAEKYVESHREGRGFQAVVEPLSPYTSYTCSVQLYNIAGASDAVLEANTKTSIYFPDQPENVTLHAATSNTLSLTWHPPKYLNGQIKYYQTFLMRYEADYFIPNVCDAVIEASKTDNKGDETASVFKDLSPAVKYIIQIAAQNDFGLGQYTAPFLVVTKPDVPGPVTDVNVTLQGPSPDPDVYSANVTIYWTIPCKSNGDIEWFELSFTGTPAGEESITFKRLVEPDTSNKAGRMSYTETDLQPEVNYSVNISVKTRGVDTTSTGAQKDWTSPSGLPSNLGEDLVKNMRVNPYDTNHPTTSAIVTLPANILTSESGNIIYIALLLSQKNCAGEPELKYDVLGTDDWPSILSWEQVGGDCIYQYQTTPERWNPRSGRDTSDESITFTIGTDKCPDESKRFCNGPLTANTEYNMVVRLFTSSGYNDAALLEFKTDAAIKVTLILVSVCSCLLLAFVLGLVLLWVRKRIAWHRDSGQGIEDPFGNVIAKNFAIFYEEVAKPEKLAREFKEITVVALELSYSAAELGSNKNRYADIYPYDKNRVILDIDTEGSDYINASFIDGHTTKKEYIATQGPKLESIMDFWRMVLQHNVRIIVQVTQFREGNTVKCNEYFPYKMRGLSVTIKSKEHFDIYDRTELCVVHDKYGLKEKVVHLYFKKWPDHGCPDDPMHLITFVKKVKAEKRPNYSPIVVHCSAGVGRTGTFIGLDLIMQRLKSESKINIFETVKKLRFQRMKMVQTQQQYTFLYACTYELVKHKIPRAALKLEGRTKPNTPPPSNTKKVSFPIADAAAVHDVPDPELGNGENGTTTLSLRINGLRKQKDLGSLYEQPERNSYGRHGNENEEVAI
ncbi:phosphatidylinositol phosphatase PTPRQ [Drosophila nasuta]|uniref:phosphatidylinositol phosphatase PTPRQ n=1 Tax=Drosophila nasuta TaxID=42062 RepID=UPI00295F4716|nr:phosphatidylinositol phosphatase PTPRQ [Drosophila nasuta]XP_060653337.1 phosphatidylinositol phosphatase PTPRQ [Drosophila nasuta]